ncbi:MAG: hypothetical protein O2960_18730 [Verrucomicrobia bacterium]|nr:hypothetical protein [Verrucomicrobiota bacterium]
MFQGMRTILTELDEIGTEDDGIDLVAVCSGYTFCPECGHVDDGHENRRNFPCQTCGKKCDTRQHLFAGDERAILEMIFECYRSKKSQAVCVLLFCSLMELHLRMLLIGRCRRLKMEWPFIDSTLKQMRGFDQRLNLFESLTEAKWNQSAAPKEIARVFSSYKSLAEKRHKLAHGLIGVAFAVTTQEIRLAVESAADSFSMFAYLHHKYCAVDSPPPPKDFPRPNSTGANRARTPKRRHRHAN